MVNKKKQFKSGVVWSLLVSPKLFNVALPCVKYYILIFDICLFLIGLFCYFCFAFCVCVFLWLLRDERGLFNSAI